MSQGLYLQELLDYCLGLGPTITEALETAGLDPLSTDGDAGMIAEWRSKKRPTPPFVEVQLAGTREVVYPAMEQNRVEAVTVNFSMLTQGGQREALAYEGVLKVTLAGLQAAAKAAVTDAELMDWWIAPDVVLRPASFDGEQTNNTYWQTLIGVVVKIGW